MKRAVVDGFELQYEVRGAGEPIVFIHAGHFADWFEPLVGEPALAGYRRVTYHRAGCTGSSALEGPLTIAQSAAHCRGLLRELGIERAHVVGHSSSGNVALQVALDAPEVVATLALLEPALLTAPSSGAGDRTWFDAALRQYRDGDHASALDTFLRGLCGPEYRRVLDHALPNAFAQHVADAETFFRSELPAMRDWQFTEADARAITCPVLAVVGGKSLALSPIWGERQQLLEKWLPDVEPYVLPDATHLLQVENPRAMAERLEKFLTGHSISR